MQTIDDAALRHANDQVTTDVADDNFVSMELAMARDEEGEMLRATVKRRLTDEEEHPVGKANANLLLDSRMYAVEYADGHYKELTANVIAENLLAQVDNEGRRQMMLSEIINHRVLPNAIPRSQGTYENAYGVKRQKVTSRGWQILVGWVH